MRPASKLKAAHANYGNPIIHAGCNVFLWMLGAAGEPRRCLLGKLGITTIASNAYYCILIKLKILTFQVV